LHKNLVTSLSPVWEKLAYLKDNPRVVDRIIEEGNSKARAIAQETMRKVLRATKLGW
jgi:tryptophanyl-tRNA synthetase